MRGRFFPSTLTLAFTMGCAFLASVTATGRHSASAQRNATLSPKTARTWTAPRTPWGDPDLQGIYTNIDELTIPLERPGRFDGRKVEDVTEAELTEFTRESNETRRRAYEQGFNRNATATARNRYDLKPSRAWLVVDPPDGMIPPLTAEAQQRVFADVARQARLPDSYEDLSTWYRCISLGLPRSMMPTVDEQPYRIVQAPEFVAITYEMIHEARVIPLDGRAHVGPTIRSYMGDARGHWEGGSLGVETTNFLGRSSQAGGPREDMLTSFPPGASNDLRIVERFKPIAPKTVEWSVTFHDASAWARSWTIAMNLTKSEESQHAFEYACHEGNLTLSNLLISARVDEKAAEEAAREPEAVTRFRGPTTRQPSRPLHPGCERANHV